MLSNGASHSQHDSQVTLPRAPWTGLQASIPRPVTPNPFSASLAVAYSRDACVASRLGPHDHVIACPAQPGSASFRFSHRLIMDNSRVGVRLSSDSEYGS